jgi:metal-sulfur cluster biosynthetic enzyme
VSHSLTRRPEVTDPRAAACLAALEQARDPELGISLVGLGLIRGIAVDGSQAQVRLTFTSMGCPWMDWITDSVRQAVLSVPGIQNVDIEVVWDRPWSPRDLRPDARQDLDTLGIMVP